MYSHFSRFSRSSGNPDYSLNFMNQIILLLKFNELNNIVAQI